MTILPWPKPAPPARSATPRKRAPRTLPDYILHPMVAGIPGPRGETEAERATRFQAQLQEVLACHPRNAAEAMLATQRVLMRVLAEDARRDAATPGTPPAHARQANRHTNEFDKLRDELLGSIQEWQRDPLPTHPLTISDYEEMSRQIIASLLHPEPAPPAPAAAADEHPDDAEEAFSAVIVPLHPAPKLLQ